MIPQTATGIDLDAALESRARDGHILFTELCIHVVMKSAGMPDTAQCNDTIPISHLYFSVYTISPPIQACAYCKYARKGEITKWPQ